jgi:GntR family transcriptional regulator
MLVAERRSPIKQDREQMLRPVLERAAAEARQLELDPEAVITLFAKILEENK